MARPRSFAKRMRAFAKDIPRQQNEIKKELAIESVLQVVPDTPVLSGQARSNWTASLGSPNNSFILFGPFTTAGDNAVNRARAVIAGAKPGQDIYLTNNLPYIERLNNGYSKQAPAMFFEIAIARAKGILKRQVIRYGKY